MPYPWIPTETTSRSVALINVANKDLANVSRGPLQISKSAVSTPELKSSALGIFATRDIKQTELILNTRTPIGISNKQMLSQCYNCHVTLPKTSVHFACCPKLKFCSSECRDVADMYYHKTLCAKDFEHLYRTMRQSGFETTDAPPFFALVWLRILAVCVEMGEHPLKNPIFARLASQYSFKLPHNWSFQSRIVSPVQILQKLGVDVFSHFNYDAWVLETLWYALTATPLTTFG